MSIDPTYRKIFAGVASHGFMFELLDLPVDASPEDILAGAAYAGRWFEIGEASYDEMLDRLPPLFMRPGMFAFGELKAGHVGSVFFEIMIDGRKRWFQGYCDLSDREAPDAMRAAIIVRETGDTDFMTREQKLDAIWATTDDDFRAIPGVAPDGSPEQRRRARTILVFEPGLGTVLKYLDALTDAEIAERLPRRR